MMRSFMLIGFAACLCTPAWAAGTPATFEELFAPISHGACVSIDDVRSAGPTVQLTPEQFQFVRAFWMAIPPASRELPPGDKAFLAKDVYGDAVLGLIDDDGKVCAVFKATDWIERIVAQVGRGETGKRGEPL